ncbi:MAG: hypothetical protein WB760_02215 [Xanthobacteraceae bacterium]
MVTRTIPGFGFGRFKEIAPAGDYGRSVGLDPEHFREALAATGAPYIVAKRADDSELKGLEVQILADGTVTMQD